MYCINEITNELVKMRYLICYKVILILTHFLYTVNSVKRIKFIDLLYRNTVLVIKRFRSFDGKGAIVVSFFRLCNFALSSSHSRASRFLFFPFAPSHFLLRNLAFSHLRPKRESAKVEVVPLEHHNNVYTCTFNYCHLPDVC